MTGLVYGSGRDVPAPRYVQVATRAADGSLPALVCPRGHRVSEAIVSWDGGYALNCPHLIAPPRTRCNALLWLLKLTIVRSPMRGLGVEHDDLWVLASITRDELTVMRAGRPGVWQQIDFLWQQSVEHSTDRTHGRAAPVSLGVAAACG